MIFNKHLDLEGKHAFLSASQFHWINYTEEALIEKYKNSMAKERGTILHDFAKRCIDLGQKLPKSKKTLNMYVNDAIGFKMTPEQVLYYSENCFGTADTISFKNEPDINKKVLRIHDYKSGVERASFNQLLIYAALFCLEYKVYPSDILIKLRIYQNDEIIECEPDSNDVSDIMKIIIRSNKVIEKLKKQEE